MGRTAHIRLMKRKKESDVCTAVTLQTMQREIFLGRNMDFSYPIESALYLVPKGKSWVSVPGKSSFRDLYGFIGIGQEFRGKITLFDGVNERGFAVAALCFAGCSHFPQPADPSGKPMLAAQDAVRFLLGCCSSVQDLRRVLDEVRLVSVLDPVTNIIPSLHWMAVDRSGTCAVIEQTEDGLHLWNNPAGVLADGPDLRWQLMNLRHYAGAEPAQKPSAQWGKATLTPVGNGSGTNVLPGGYASPARFVRTAYQKSFAMAPANRQEAVAVGFHLLEGSSLTKGVVNGSRGTVEFTQYTAFINTATGEYFFRTYYNSQVFTAKIPSDMDNRRDPVCLGVLKRPPVFETLGE